MRLINKDTDYAITALCYLAERQNEVPSVSALSGELEISYSFLRKIFHILQTQDIVHSQKGKGGGFSLARGAGKIRIIDIMEIFQGPITIGNCAIGKKVCRQLDDCVLRGKLQTIRENMVSELRELTIESLITNQVEESEQ